MDVSAILAGQCYVDAAREKYSVIAINRGIVTYRSWTSDPKQLSLRTNAGVKAFANAVVRQIACPAAE
jgi:hypothetical protein